MCGISVRSSCKNINTSSQVGLLLHVASVLVYLMWKRGEDPDNSAIPYLTALGDLLGGILLASVFHVLY